MVYPFFCNKNHTRGTWQKKLKCLFFCVWHLFIKVHYETFSVTHILRQFFAEFDIIKSVHLKTFPLQKCQVTLQGEIYKEKEFVLLIQNCLIWLKYKNSVKNCIICQCSISFLSHVPLNGKINRFNGQQNLNSQTKHK